MSPTSLTLRDPMLGITATWPGRGHTVNIVAFGDCTGAHIDCISVGDFARDSATRAEARSGILRYFAALRRELESAS